MAIPILTKIKLDDSEASKKIKEFAEEAGQAFKGLGGLLATAAAGFAAIGLAASKATQQSNELARASFFGVGIKQAQAFQKELGGVVSEMQALQELTSLKVLGFDDDQIKSVAEMTSKIRALTGASTQAALAMVKTGEGVEQLGAVLGTRGLGAIIENELIKKIGSRVPTATEKAQAAFRVLQRQLSQLQGNFRRADLADPFVKLRVAVQDAQTRIIRKFLPELLKIAKDLETTIIPAMITGTKTIVFLIKEAIEQFRFLKKEMDAGATPVGKTANAVLGFVKNVKVLGVSIDDVSKLYSSLWDDGKKAMNDVANQQKKAAKSTTNAVKKQVGDAAKSLDALRKKNKKAATQATREALDELLGFQSQARGQVRNFMQFFLNNVATAGGTVAGVISAFKDIPEQLRILGSFRSFNRVLQDTRKLTLAEIVNMREMGELTDRQAKVAALGNTIRKAGTADLKEFLRNQKTVTRQLAAGLAISESAAQLAEVAAAKNDLQTDILTSQQKLNEVILGVRLKLVGIADRELALQGRLENSLAKQTKLQGLLNFLGDRKTQTKQAQATIDATQKQLKLEQRRSATLRAQIATNALNAKRANEIAANARKANVEYSKQAKEQRRLIGLMELRAKLTAKELDKLKTENETANRVNDAKQARLALDAELQRLQVGISSAVGKEQEGKQKVLELEQKLRELAIERTDLDIKRRTAATTQDANLAASRIKAIDQVVKLTKDQLATQKLINDATMEQEGMLGALAAKVRENGGEFLNLGKRIGQELGDSIAAGLDFAIKRFQFMGTQIARIMSGLKAENVAADLGTGFLELLSGLTGNFAAAFASISAAYIASGNVPQGIATGAAAAGLGVLSGVFAGFSSIAQKASAPEGTASSSGANTSAFRQSLSDEPLGLSQRDTRVIFVASERFNGTPEEQWNRLVRHAGEMTELTGLNLPTAVRGLN